jgi:hypothetical protein
VVTVPHVPFVPPVNAAAHAWQVPLHAIAQQNPVTQNPVAHSPPPVQAVPFAAPPSVPVSAEESTVVAPSDASVPMELSVAEPSGG